MIAGLFKNRVLHGFCMATRKLHTSGVDLVPGFVYLVTCPNNVYAKYGMWTGTLGKLKSRYATYYDRPHIMAVWSSDPRSVEKRIKARVIEENLRLDESSARELVRCGPKMRRLFMEEAGLGQCVIDATLS